MSNLEALLLGIVQGISEFLPISSSGHLVLVRYHLGWGASLPLYVGIATNTGTLIAVLIALWQDVLHAFQGLGYGLSKLYQRQQQITLDSQRLDAQVPSVQVDMSSATNTDVVGGDNINQSDTDGKPSKQESWRLVLLVLLGSLPTALIGLGLEPFFERLGTPVLTSLALILTGVVVWFVPKTGTKTHVADISWWDALLVGTVQGLAVMPGISRAGVTIAYLLWRGVDSTLAARVSFLMYLVVSFGVTLLGLRELAEVDLALTPLIIMLVTSLATGYVALQVLLRLLRRGQLHRFSPYLWGIAALTLLRFVLS
ncbi:MAG: undecaprenyl-diphosphate phosphatase [Deinococcota bacterium]